MLAPDPLDAKAEPTSSIDPKREVAELRALAIKTNNLVTALNADLKGIGRRLEQRERTLTLNSAVAYVLFVVLLGGGFYVAHRLRVDRADFEKEAALREAAASREALGQTQRAGEERRRGEDRAYELYQLLRGGRARDAVSKYPEVSRERLSRVEAEVLREGVARGRQELAYGAFEAGRQAYGASSWKRAAQEFRRAVEIEPSPPHAAQLYYLYGITLFKLADYPAAATELERAVEKGAERNVQNDAGFYLAAALDQAKKRDRAKAEYRKFLTKYPQSHFASTAKRRLSELEAAK
ncbi:MAG TPA: outer membrane protein assembly factor BamD [Polyangia bacterium]